VGIGIITLWRLFQKHTAWGISLLAAAAAATVWFQFATARLVDASLWWFPLVIILSGVGVGLLIISLANRPSLLSVAGFGAVVAALFITPGIWSGLTMLTANQNQSLPAAYAGRDPGPLNRGGLQVNQSLIDFLNRNTTSDSYLMAVPSSMQGTDYVLRTGRPVLYLGGFMGQDKVETGDSLAKLVAAGQLRYIYWDARVRGGFVFGGSGLQTDISKWITANCTIVTGFDTLTQNSGAPDGTSSAAITLPITPGQFGGGLRVSLYDCAHPPSH
jgi:4-amino-4-deoxy-L-arabinose transferase-like glycosyltransferase